MSTELGRTLLKNFATKLEGMTVMIEGREAKVNPDIIRALRRASEEENCVECPLCHQGRIRKAEGA